MGTLDGERITQNTPEIGVRGGKHTTLPSFYFLNWSRKLRISTPVNFSKRVPRANPYVLNFAVL